MATEGEVDAAEIFQCRRCGYEGTKKDYLMNHLKRKIECKPLLEDISTKTLLDALYTREKNSYNPATDSYVCSYCKKHYSSSMTKYRHTKTCPVKLGKAHASSAAVTVIAKPKDTTSDRINTLEKELRIIKQELARRDAAATVVNQQTNVNVTTTNHNTINIVDFGKENLASLSPAFLQECLRHCQPNETLPSDGDGQNGIVKLLKQIHSVSENKNIRVRNLNQNMLDTRINNTWRVADKNDVLNKRVNQGFNIINTYKVKNKTLLNDDDRFDGIMEDIDEYLGQVGECNKRVCDPIKRELLLMLVNDKDDIGILVVQTGDNTDI